MLAKPHVTAALIILFAYLALTIAGAVLWRRRGSAAGAAIAIGFALAFLGQVAQLVEYLEVNSLLRDHPGDTLYIVHHHACLRYAALLGLPLAAAGLMWHAMSAAFSPEESSGKGGR